MISKAAFVVLFAAIMCAVSYAKPVSKLNHCPTGYLAFYPEDAPLALAKRYIDCDIYFFGVSAKLKGLFEDVNITAMPYGSSNSSLTTTNSAVFAGKTNFTLSGGEHKIHTNENTNITVFNYANLTVESRSLGNLTCIDAFAVKLNYVVSINEIQMLVNDPSIADNSNSSVSIINKEFLEINTINQLCGLFITTNPPQIYSWSKTDGLIGTIGNELGLVYTIENH